MSKFQALEVVDRGSETQPQVVENLNKLTEQTRARGNLLGWCAKTEFTSWKYLKIMV